MATGFIAGSHFLFLTFSQLDMEHFEANSANEIIDYLRLNQKHWYFEFHGIDLIHGNQWIFRGQKKLLSH
jgi:hypothetical protein